MEKIIIEGKTRLSGEIKVSGAKNAVLPIMAACILNDGENTISNVPDLADVRTMIKLLETLGAKCEYSDGELLIDSSAIRSYKAPYELVKTMRASVLVLGPLVARFRKAEVSLPGGCAIGERPIDQHIKGLRILGASVRLEDGYVSASAKKLEGTTVPFDLSTVTGTENIMLIASVCEGETVILNAACEPEVVDLANALNLMGAKIEGAGTDIITITGVSSLGALSDYTVMPDRIEAGTLMIAGALNESNLTINGCRFEHLGALSGKLLQTGAWIEKNGDSSIRVKGAAEIRSIDFSTLPYPGFPTDMQAQMMILMCLADGMSVITENIFPQRFMHTAELRRMGADIKLVGNSAVVRGVREIKGAPIMASDLRASASLVLAGLCGTGKTEVSRIYHLDRGYEKLDEKLRSVGASIWREKE
ncbi:MAG: UDP-N-acetylglucosamine 1-carboxyvinyltransferase [Candidatus Dadabacteria bacterium]|nr:UDP-N-acetylglucosamine 1-carboxyvinyltransferase [Candidatus Dadabacteria bacterium]MCY4262367.1 UDP-N-acetylglucosamine 1-carboxyvinyltransferase [Candidatus Dadabacteria bacterium]